MRVAPGGYRLAAVPAGLAALSLAGGLLVTPLLLVAALAGVVLAALFVAFHRDPDRTPTGTGVLSAADGTVSEIAQEDGRVRIAVYMSPTNVHVNRAPTAGTVEAVTHEPGGHRPAFDKDSDRNERVHVDFDDVRVTQIAGAVARRIHPYVEAGETVDRGERIGHISFGSRVDVTLPPAFDRSDVRVAVDDRVRAGETVLARRAADTDR